MIVTKIKLNPWNFVGGLLLGLLAVLSIMSFATAESSGGFSGIFLVFFLLPILFVGLIFYLLFSAGATNTDDVTVSGQAAKNFPIARIIRVVAWAALVAIAGFLAFIISRWA